mmetsp:Transcript_23600/g.51112  ORF Transcript_23600/g.51112 Transcript_23600/m.51112 type:complete len:187 (-) Transcript_23600:343-903(-)|eukprot:CAMPEP_0172311396 /NCGR_PEP_ID=MMETSP1058-20130122/14649_1 /TAXON_ID=83371 /ORGANISM="Detonula confervacea, Strain CCMP 353" /LENGTH=186 /DNA_ID=CAMNT_0013024561 /DNA_START=89 /DNA_END=649 /DNA_ORIENTATION=+
MIDDVLAAIDHLSGRVTASAMTGMGCGAAYATFKGFPIFKTSMSTAVSFALVSTACFGMERVANVILRQSSMLIDGKSIASNPDDDNGDDSSIIQPTTNSRLYYGSHALGGFFGGGVVGFLFKGNPMAGAFLLTPIMLGIGKIEVSLDEYRNERLQQLIKDIDQESDQEQNSTWNVPQYTKTDPTK